MLKSTPEYLRARFAIMLSSKESAKFRNPENGLAKRGWSRGWLGDAVDVAVQRLPLILTKNDGARQIRGSSCQHRGIQDSPGDDGIQRQRDGQSICRFQLA